MLDALPYYNALAKKGERAKYTAKSLKSKLREDNYSVLVAKDGSGLLGFAISHLDDYLVWLDWFMVDPKARRKGVGSALLHAMMETAPRRGAHKVWCDCRTDNEASKAILKRNGFARIAEVRNHWYGQDFILWERPV